MTKPPPSDLAPESKAIYEMASGLGLLDADATTVQDFRELALKERSMMGTALAVKSVEELAIEGGDGPIHVRVYRPVGEPAERSILWLHGGGWVIGDLEHADNDCRGLCAETQSTVISVDYRLAPEHPFPAGLEDAYAALSWATAELKPGDHEHQLVVGGDSAGGNLAAALCLMARDRGGPRIDHQLMLYPVTGNDCNTPSHERFADGYLLSREDMLRFWELYTGDAETGRDPLASVLRAIDLRRLPAATIVIAGCDVLRDEAETYAERLRSAEVPVEVLRYPGQLHGFWTYRGASNIATSVNAAIRKSLGARR